MLDIDVFISIFFSRTFDVRPPARLKGERNEIEKLVAGWCDSICSALILYFGSDLSPAPRNENFRYQARWVHTGMS